MTKIDLQDLTLKELQQLRKNLDAAIISHTEQQKTKAMAALKATAKEFGFTLNELILAKKTAKRVIAPKYLNPNDPSQTWSGRGRMPEWVKKALEAGKTREDLAI